MQIGTICIGSPTRYYDVTLLMDSCQQVQAMLDLAKSYEDKHKYMYTTKKTTVITALLKSLKKSVTDLEDDYPEWHLGGYLLKTILFTWG
jgi:hypothetical protein